MNPFSTAILCKACLENLRDALPAHIRQHLLRAFVKGATRAECIDVFHRAGSPPWMLLAVADHWDQLEENRLHGT